MSQSQGFNEYPSEIQAVMLEISQEMEATSEEDFQAFLQTHPDLAQRLEEVFQKEFYVLLYNVGTEHEAIHTLSIENKDIVLLFESSVEAEFVVKQLERQNFPIPTIGMIDFNTIVGFCHNSGYFWEVIKEGENRTVPSKNNLSDEYYYQILMTLLETVAIDKSEKTYQLITQIRHNSNEHFIGVMQRWFEVKVLQNQAKINNNKGIAKLFFVLWKCLVNIKNKSKYDRAIRIANILEWSCVEILNHPDGCFAQDLMVVIEGLKLVLIICNDNPERYSQTLNLLGYAYQKLAENGVNSEINLRKAIEIYEKSAENCLKNNMERKLSSTLNDLGIAYRILAEFVGNSEINLRKAIAICEECTQICEKLDLEEDLAGGLLNLGNTYVDLAKIGCDSEAILRKAIIIYGKSIELYRKLSLEENLSISLNSLGIAYFNFAELSVNREVNFKDAIKVHKESIKICKKLGLGKILSDGLLNLGNVYARLAEIGVAHAEIGVAHEVNSQKAIALYEEALEIFRKLGLELNLSRTLNNLGIVHLALGQKGSDSIVNLQKSIAFCEEALEIFRKLGLERALSDSLLNLGVVYITLVEIGVDRETNLKNAVTTYEQSAQISRKLGLDNELSQALNNLTEAYRILANMGKEREANLRKAIGVAEEAVKIFRKLNLERNLSSSLHNLGMVYTDLAAFCSNREEDLVKAVEKYTEAAEIRKKLALEKDLSATLLSLGNVYSLFTIIDINNEINLEKVIETYKEAAAICDKLNLKRDLAKILHNLGMFYEKQDIFSEAIACYRKSLTILEKMNVFTDSQRTGTNLGNLAFKKGDWETALEGYEPALKAIEMMRGYLKDDGKRQKVLVDSLTIYANAIQCCINLKQYKKAIEISERARSRHLVELMASADLYQKGQIPEEILLYLSQYQDIQNRINQILQQRPDEGDTFLGGSTLLGGFTLDNLRADQTAQNEILKTLFQEKQTVWQELRQRDPVLAGTLEVPEFTWQDLTTLLQHQPQTALLSFYTTSDKLHIFFIVRPTDNPDDPLNISLHTCENQGYLTLQAWLWEEWFNPYVQISAPENTENEKNLLKQWIERMPDRLQTLADHLDLNTLTQTHLDQIQELIIIPHFLLHQIPLAALPIGDHYLGDQYRLRIVPSAQILKYCQDRENNNSHAPFVPASHLGTVEAAGSQSDISLYIVNLGFELIAQSLGIPKSQRIQREQATRDRYHHLAHNRHIQALHSIHHAAANLSDPHLSALLLADGNISLQELISPQWRMPQMIDVLLTCCETHLGNPNFTDDILTLGTGFLCAGARSVVSTLWQVDALATTFFCEFYYDYRQQGSDRPTALYQAQTQLRTLSKKETLKRVEKYLEVTYANRQQQPKVYNILSRQYAQLNSDRSQKPPYASPYYWAGFTLQGLR